MLDPIVLDFQVKGVEFSNDKISKLVASMKDLDKVNRLVSSSLEPVSRRIRSIGTSADSSTRKVAKLGAAMAALPQNVPTAPSSPSRSPSRSPSGNRNASAPGLPSSYRSYINAGKALQNARSMGDPLVIAAAQQSFQKSYNNLLKAGQPIAPPVDPRMRAIMSSRVVNQNGAFKLMPLAHQLPSLLANVGSGSIASLSSGAASIASAVSPGGVDPISIASKIASAEIVLLGVSAKLASDHVRLLGSSSLTLDTSLSGANKVAGIGNASGTNFSDIASGIRDALRNDPVAGSIARSYGVNPYSTRTGYNDDAADMAMKVLKGFLFDPNAKRASIAAQNIPGLSEFGYARYASDEMKDRLVNAQGPHMSPEQMRGLANAEVAVYIELGKLKNTMIEIGSDALPVLVTGLRVLGVGIKALGAIIEANPAYRALKWASNNRSEGSNREFVPNAYGGYSKNPDYTGPEQKAIKSQDRLRDSIQNLDRTIREGTYGSGASRARRALPIGLGGHASGNMGGISADFGAARANGSTVW